VHLLDLFDAIIVMSDGRVTDIGTAAELSARSALPARLAEAASQPAAA
jgi:ABC-type multidrug transport system fused ATPase/permease subunit